MVSSMSSRAALALSCYLIIILNTSSFAFGFSMSTHNASPPLLGKVVVELSLLSDQDAPISNNSRGMEEITSRPSRRSFFRNAASLGTATAAAILCPATALSADLPEPAADDTNEPPFRVLLTVQVDAQTTGEIEIEVVPSWAPRAAARFQDLVRSGFYDDARFYRVLPGYVAQFGIASDPQRNQEWVSCRRRSSSSSRPREDVGAPSDDCRYAPLQDEPRTERNKKGTLSFASSGENSRQTQVFINLGDNDGLPNFLDAQGFVPFAKVVTKNHMDTVVSKLNSEYGLLESLSGGLTGSVNQGKAAYYGKEYLDALFPKLSYIKTAKIL